MNRYNIINYNESLLNNIINLLQHDKYNRFRKDISFDNDKVDQYQKKEIESILDQRDENFLCICLINYDELLGFAVLRKSKWDSEILKKNIWNLEYIINNETDLINRVEGNSFLIGELLRICNVYRIDLLIARIDTENYYLYNQLIKNGFRLIESILYMSREIEKSDEHMEFIGSVSLRFAEEKDIAKINERIPNLFQKSRFYKEKTISKNLVNVLYQKWIKDSYYDESISFHIAEIENQIAGFWLNHKQNTIRDLGKDIIVGRLTGVFPEFRGKGIMKNLAIHSIKTFADNNIVFDGSAVLENQASINTLISLDFKNVYSFHTLHLTIK